MSLIRRRQASAASSEPDFAFYDAGAWAGVYDALSEFLTLASWGEGQPRETGTVMLLAEDGVWKAWLHDRDAGCSCWLSGKTPQALLEAIDRGLRTDGLTWKADRPNAGRTKRKG